MTRFLRIAALILAGEMIYGLPFHTQRFFRPTMLDAFGITNTQLGDMFAAFGITAMVSYFFGGPLADRYSARSLMVTSLILTALGGFYMATIPGVLEMTLLYAFWGVTTSFLFWAALIKATRDWGGSSSQGVAFGVLDGGRGLAAAILGAVAVGILASFLPEQTDQISSANRRAGMGSIITFYASITLACAVLAWFLVPHDARSVNVERNPFAGVMEVIRRPLVWAQAGIIICAYCGYKGVDNYSLYAVQVLGKSEVDAALLATYGFYIRPVAAIAAGLIADRFDSARSIFIMFLAMIITYGSLSVLTLETTTLFVIFANLFVTLFAVFAIRGIYYALLEETRTPKHLTGASVAVIAFVGYTPEIFFGPVTGRILDANPGVPGFHNYFLFLAIVSSLGALVSLLLIKLNRRPATAAGESTLATR
ncbi:MAG: MFS transporter [Woeseiaceae bacterium]